MLVKKSLEETKRDVSQNKVKLISGPQKKFYCLKKTIFGALWNWCVTERAACKEVIEKERDEVGMIYVAADLSRDTLRLYFTVARLSHASLPIQFKTHSLRETILSVQHHHRPTTEAARPAWREVSVVRNWLDSVELIEWVALHLCLCNYLSIEWLQ